ncbi:MAG: molecular chaperone TorD [Alcaligenaceae bacterium]|nr:molecular chaperone TorD [Alcaligenaceae bacterium]
MPASPRATPEEINADWAVISRSRADLYAWFSSLFAAELSDDTVAAYRQGQARPLLDAFHAIGLEAGAQRLAQALQGWAALPHLRVELAADFARLFLFDARNAAAPYASAYLDSQFFGEPHRQMQAFLASGGLRVQADFKEPADHLAVFLAFMEDNIRKAEHIAPEERPQAAAMQADFLNEALLSWLPQFEARCQALRGETVSDFYPAAATLLLAFTQADAASLSTDSPE